MSELSHVGEAGDVHMVDVGGKPFSRRRAVARATVPKRTSELIPLCHPLPLSHVEVSLQVREQGVEVTAVVETTAQTGVEMEALTAVSVAALTVYDMAKAIDKQMSVTEVTLVEKTKEPA